MHLLSVYGFLLLGGSVSLPPLFVEGQAFGFCSVPRYYFACNRPYINKDDLIYYDGILLETGLKPTLPSAFTLGVTLTSLHTGLTQPQWCFYVPPGAGEEQDTAVHHRFSIQSFLTDWCWGCLNWESRSVCLWIRDFLTDCPMSHWLVWCTEKNLILNTTNIKEVILDFRMRNTAIQPLFVGGNHAERTSWFQGVSSTVEALLKREHPHWHISIEPCIITLDPNVVKSSD